MRERTKRFTVAIAGLALAGGGVLAAAPAAEAATVATTTTSVAGATAAGWDHDRDHRDGRRWHHGERRHWKHWKKRHHGHGYGHGHHRHWRDHGRYSSYREAYLIGERYRGSSWESYNCSRVGGGWVLRVYG